MNKAEEQYSYQIGKLKAQVEIMETAKAYKISSNLPAVLIKHCENEIKTYEKYNTQLIAKGKFDYYSSILNVLKFKLITDWPSFVTYMTGEKYE